MRADMDKVLVERPRLGGTRVRVGRLLPLDERPANESIKPRWRGYRKSLNENLSPLKKYLLSHVGRPWDKVYSEIRANISMDNTVQRHITEHIFQYVQKDVRVDEDGKIFEGKILRYGRNIELRAGDMYVCPTSGILKKVRVRPRVKAKPKTTRIKIDSKRMAVLKKLEDRAGNEVGEVWFEVTLAPLPNKLVTRVDPLTKKTISEYPTVTDVYRDTGATYSRPVRTYFGTQSGGCDESRKLYGDAYVYATKAKQMNSRELRKIGL